MSIQTAVQLVKPLNAAPIIWVTGPAFLKTGSVIFQKKTAPVWARAISRIDTIFR